MYGRGKAMPEGIHCQYNILEIEQNDKKVNVTLHVREDETGWHIPSWRKKQINGKDSYLMEFNLPDIDYKRILSDCISQAKTEDTYLNAVRTLIAIRDKEPSADKFIDDFLKKLSNIEICSIEFVPRTIAQKISVLGACVETHAWNMFDKIVNDIKLEGINDANINILITEANKIR